MVLRYTIPLAPVSKKNSQRIARGKNGRPFILPSKKYEEYEENALWRLRPRPESPIAAPVNVKCVFYMPTRRRVDLVNLLEAIDDVLVAARVLLDDHSGIVRSHDGSRVHLDRHSPRTEIEITEVETDDDEI